MNDKRVDAWRWTGPALCLGLAVAPIAMGAGGIQTDGTVGANGNWLGRPQALSGANVTIGQEMGTTAGRNLFHSFSEFNVNRGQTVTFTGNSGLRNVISRVTGGSGSDIDGTLRSTVGKADVYLINPNGVTFGANARVDVPAAFHVSTADEIRLKDGARYSARDVNGSSLSAAEPSAFGYLGTSPANNGLLKVDGAQLEVKPGQSLDLAAGEIRVEGGAALKAEAGEVRLTASRGRQEVSLERDGDGHLPLADGPRTEENAGEIIIDNSTVDVSGDGSGRIGVDGGRIGFRGGARLASSNAGATHASPGKGIRVEANTLSVDQSVVLADAKGTGDGPAISVRTAADMAIDDGGAISASAYDRGQGGNLRIVAGGSVSVLKGSQVFTTASGAGNAGSLSVQAGRDILVDGRGATPLSTVLASETFAPGADAGGGGAVSLQAAGSVSLVRGAVVDTAAHLDGDAGTLQVRAGGDVVIDGFSLLASQAAPGSTGGKASSVSVAAGGDVQVLHDSELSSTTNGPGDAGNVKIEAGRDVTVFGGADRSSRVGSGADEGPGNAGAVLISAGRDVNVLSGGQLGSSTHSSGNAGSITALAGRDVLVDSQGAEVPTGIAAQAIAGSTGDAGSVLVNAQGRVRVVNSGGIASTTAGVGKGGPVTVSAGGDVIVDGLDASHPTGISSGSEAPDSGDAGDVFVESRQGDVRIMNGGQIAASTWGQGNAGGVTVTAANDLHIASSGNGARGGIAGVAQKGSTGVAGAVTAHADRDVLLGVGGAISSDTLGRGNAGSVAVTAGRDLRVDGGGHYAAITSSAQDAFTGNAGRVQVSADRDVVIRRGGAVETSTFGAGIAGTVSVSARGDVTIAGAGKGSGRTGVFSRAATGSTGDAGKVSVSANRQLSVQKGGAISTSSTGAGAAGAVKAAGSSVLVDAGEISAASIGPVSGGQTGGVRISAGESLRMANRAKISIENDAARLLADPAETLPAKAGTIRIDSPDILMSDSEITTQSKGDINAGDIRLAFSSRLSLQNSSITTSAKTGDGGSITVVGGGTLRLQNSRIRSSVTGKRGNGGDIALTAQNLVMETGLIEADAISGNGGNVTLDVQALIPSGNRINGRDVAAGDYLRHAAEAGDWRPGTFASNIIRAVSQTGLSGNISLTAPQLNLSGAIANLGNPAFDTAEVSPDACTSEPSSSLSVSGRGGLPPRPRDWLLY